MRELILRSLQSEGHLSGEELGRRLNISRTAVWKHVNELRRQGYRIESSPKSGYSYIANTRLLLPEEIASGLNTQVMGKHIEHFDEVTSTQDIAAGLAVKGAAEGTLVIAETQNHGRGRKGRNWLSPEEGIYLSLILRPNLLPSKAVQIPLLAGIAMTRAIRNVVPLQPTIKWPNDILFKQKKIGGILTEMSSEIDGVNYVILGIGVNVNIPTSFLTAEKTGLATSLIAAHGTYIPRVKIVQSFLNEFEMIYNRFLSGGFRVVRNEWKTLDNTIGSRVKVNDGVEDIAGLALDIDEDGFLLVQKEDGEISRIISGDVTFSNGIG